RAALAPEHAHLDAFAAAVFGRVGNEVGHHLVDAVAVPPPLDRLALEVETAVGGGNLLTETFDDVRHQPGEVEERELEVHLARADPRDVEKIADEPIDAPALRGHLLGPLSDDAGLAAIDEEPEAPHLERERLQRRAELVAGDRKEVVAERHRVPRL